MMRMRALLLPLVAAGCIWLPLGSDAIPRVALLEVQRSSGSGPVWAGRPGLEPGGRGAFFQDSLIAFRTQATADGVRFRLWNRRDELMRIGWDAFAAGKAQAQCPAAAAGWEMRWRGGGPPADVLQARGSREDEAVAVARIPTPRGGTWTSVPIGCLAGGAADGRAPLRLTVAAGGERYVYTFWYGVQAPPVDAGITAGAQSGEAPLRP